MKIFNVLLASVAAILLTLPAFAQIERPTIVLVHGAFADTSSWNGVTDILQKDGYTVIALANPLRSVKEDAGYLSDILETVKAPVVLVGHSYGGMVINAAASNNPKVRALVFVDAFAPEEGETAFGISAKFPGSTLPQNIGEPVLLAGGGKDLYIRPDKYWQQFAADVPEADAKLMAAGQRPITEAAGNEPAGAPAWKQIPSWFIYGDTDKNIPLQTLAFMAERARSKETVVIKGGSHVVMVSNPKAVAGLIKRAALSK